jgi:hypothetical protein
MLKGIDINEVTEYVSPHDPDLEHPTVFVLGNVPHRDKFAIMGKMDVVGTLLVGIKEIRGLVDKDGNTVAVICPVTEEVLNTIDIKVLEEIVNKIIEFNHLDELTEKNSPGQSGVK